MTKIDQLRVQESLTKLAVQSLPYQRMKEVPTKGLGADEPAMPGCCSPGIQYGVEGGAMDCCGYGGHQAPEANMEGVVVGGTS